MKQALYLHSRGCLKRVLLRVLFAGFFYNNAPLRKFGAETVLNDDQTMLCSHGLPFIFY